ncbi:hypothetical protein ACWCPX_46440, partial [Streptomyces olivaceoviridis]
MPARRAGESGVLLRGGGAGSAGRGAGPRAAGRAACALVIAERVGKAVRSPAKDTLLSHAPAA